MASRCRKSRGSELLVQWRAGRFQSVVCKLLDLDPATYNRLEHGRRRPNLELATKIEEIAAVPATSWYQPPLEGRGSKPNGNDSTPGQAST